ncbi:trypco2 family protein [Streptomyces sp. NPDC059037]|uniref:trypco2 family protein n=1 Tax=Streptomyces sp. NPDC059037 TaxID=3346710 RepID=UPI0036A1D305
MIELAEMIAQLRGELATAMAAAEHEELRFELGAVELEAEFAVQRADTADGRIRFWVVEAGASAQQTASNTHRVHLTLQPRVRATGEPPYVAGDQTPRER